MAEESTKFGGVSASDDMIRMLGLDKPAVETAEQKHENMEVNEVPLTSSVFVTKKELEENPSVTVESMSNDNPLLSGVFSRTNTDYESLNPKKWMSSVSGTLLAVVPYALIFVVGVVGYYVFFADPSNRPSFLSASSNEEMVSSLEAKDIAIKQLQSEQDEDFKKWMQGYFFDISDENLLDPNRVAPNKLTNFENYLIGLNPRTNDIRKTGVSDSSYIVQGMDPNTGLPLRDWQKDIIAKYFDLAAIEERTASSPSVLGAATSGSIQPRGPARESTQINFPSDSTSNQSLPATNTGSVVSGVPTASAAGVPAPVSTVSPSGQGCEENRLGINTAIPGRLEIASINVNVPIIWTQDQANFNEDLKTGVVHYPCTPLPGDIGKAYISGHSSNYTWAGGSYNKVFVRMNELEPGMTFKVTVVGQDGKDVRLFYVIQSKQEYEADDQAQFVNTAYSEVALSTCWPINTTKRRLVTVARLDRIER